MVYDSSVRLRLGTVLIVALPLAFGAWAQDAPSSDKPDAGDSKSEPKYDETFSGPIVEITASEITVSRSILGKPPEKRKFLLKPETRIEGKLKVRAKVTVGYVTTDDGDVARLVVVRTSGNNSSNKK